MILIDFSDAPADVSLSRATQLVNGIGYTEPHVTSSLRDYWFRQSRGKVNLTQDVVGYFRAPQPASWYNSQPFIEFINLCYQALAWLQTSQPAFNWGGLSLANGAMNRAGYEEGGFLSVSFMCTAWIPGVGGTHDLFWVAPNGAFTRQITGATFKAPWDTGINLFWITHEMGHMIWGWPDTYDYTSLSYGTGRYSLMSGNTETGDIEPPGGPFIVQENWVDIIDITDQHVILPQDGNTMARFRNPFDPKEYFIIEARMQSTIGNAAFPVPRGLLIWHVDDNVTTSNIYPQMTFAEHYRVSVEQADGLFDLEHLSNACDAGDIYVPGKVFSDAVTPNANWWAGNPSTLIINSIQLLGNNKISFNASNSIVCAAGNSSNQMVNVCHNGHSLCIPKNILAQHLSHGDYIGTCNSTMTNASVKPELLQNDQLLIYPNPTGEEVNVKLNSNELDNLLLSVVDANGQVIKRVQVNGQKNIKFRIQVPGVYTIILRTNKELISQKFIVLAE